MACNIEQYDGTVAMAAKPNCGNRSSYGVSLYAINSNKMNEQRQDQWTNEFMHKMKRFYLIQYMEYMKYESALSMRLISIIYLLKCNIPIAVFIWFNFERHKDPASKQTAVGSWDPSSSLHMLLSCSCFIKIFSYRIVLRMSRCINIKIKRLTCDFNLMLTSAWDFISE